MIYRTAPFSMTFNDAYPSFKVTPFFDVEYLRNGATYRYSFNEILIGTYTRPTQKGHFEWHWVNWLSKIFSDTKRCAVSLRQLSFLFNDGVVMVVAGICEWRSPISSTYEFLVFYCWPALRARYAMVAVVGPSSSVRPSSVPYKYK